MDVLVARPGVLKEAAREEKEGRRGSLSDRGSTGISADSNGGNNNVDNKEKQVSSPGMENDKAAKQRRKKERRKKDRKSLEKKQPKPEPLKQLEEENLRLKNEIDDLNLRLAHLEAREHNKELKLIHLQKDLEETRSMLIEKEGDCVEWEHIDREKDKTVTSLNQTIAILQRDLSQLLDKERDKDKPVKKKKNIVFSEEPLVVFEYPREEDYESDMEGEFTSDEYDEYDEEGGGEEVQGMPRGDSEDEVAEEEEEQEYVGDDEIVEKDVEETTPPLFLPFPVFSHIRSEEPTPHRAEVETNPLVKIFSPTIPPPAPDFRDESPAASPSFPHHAPPSQPEPPKTFSSASSFFPFLPSHSQHNTRSNGTSSPITFHHAFFPQRSSSDSSLDKHATTGLPSSPSAPSLNSSQEDLPQKGVVKELRKNWETPNSVLSPPLSRVVSS